MTARPKMLFYVQHLLGIGHLMRAGTLSRALEARGFEVTLVSGGTHVPGFHHGATRFVQLPPTRATNKFFKVLVDEHDQIIDEAWKADRTARLLAIEEEVRPDIVLIELYPFGRRQMRFEIEPLIEAAHARPTPRPLVVSSVRDILVEPGKPERIDEMVDRVRRFFDLVLIHGDPEFISFEETFPRMGEIADVTRYTGYVADQALPREVDGQVQWRVAFAQPQNALHPVRWLPPSQVHPVETAWAITVHKAQGSEFQRVIIALPNPDSPILTREWLYTALTRARESVGLWASQPEGLALAAQRPTQRMGGLHR